LRSAMRPASVARAISGGVREPIFRPTGRCTRLISSSPHPGGGISVHRHPQAPRVLRDAGLVRVRQEAQRRWYELEPGPLTDIAEWPRPYRKFWAGRLDALERHLDAMPSPAGPDTAKQTSP
jgi:DNA-binding transcriptional ArsR family regulator